MISLADFQPLSIAKINIFQPQPRFYSQICIVSKSMLMKRSQFVDTLRDAASFYRLSSFIEFWPANRLLTRTEKNFGKRETEEL